MFLRWILDLQKKVTINTGRELQLKLDLSVLRILDYWMIGFAGFRWILEKRKLMILDLFGFVLRYWFGLVSGHWT